jgi:hypothetical protein
MLVLLATSRHWPPVRDNPRRRLCIIHLGIRSPELFSLGRFFFLTLQTSKGDSK